MEFQTAQTKLQILSGRLHYLLLISIGLLISNIFLILLVGWSFSHQKRVIVPVEFKQPFIISDSTVDASYLRQMALFFVAERLSVTPNNINQSHNLILQYTDSRFYHEFLSILDKEKQAVIKQNISSVFYPEEVMPNTKELSVLIKGTLTHWVGDTPIAPVKKNYIIKFSYRSGDLKVVSFSETLGT
jgi:conjugal transfer pilus assembly protein TraE